MAVMDHADALERLKPGTLRWRMYRYLMASSRPLFAAEVTRLLGHGHKQNNVADALRRMWNEGYIARSRPDGTLQSLWWTADRADIMPASVTPILATMEQLDTPQPRKTFIDIRAIAAGRSVFDWGGR